ncbi:autotransporter outer membrane beta-barrel domain-containing protein [Achromobacter pestifer]|uniref:Autotransporter outer membrane beta-barrel domain-containing protein n=1 Tax=Achromobacter pestifer TaxID=1353889 RepID=A0A7D4E093_9BURK|nr:autotransporter-associated beta strand repeat-containing protein [Achromobacter pestifer]QKH38435.1 autotransporter outer membrane beta-barrel domain-containing protein [Achromobacter pestifer]
MNHVYRVVFNATTGAWQAVSEIARGPGKSNRPARRARRKASQTALAFGAALAIPASVHAQLLWDGSHSVANGSVDGGAGIWDAANTNWASAGAQPNRAWNGGDAVFSGAAGTVSISGQQNFTGLEFLTDGYNLVGGTASRLNAINGLGGTVALRVAPNVTATMGVTIGDIGTLEKLGSGTLALNGNNGYAGGTRLSAGRLVAGSNTALGSGDLTAMNNTVLDANRAVTLANNVQLLGAMGIGGSADLTLNGSIAGIGSLIKNGPATLTLNGANLYQGGTTLNGGALAVGHNQALGAGGLTVGGNSTLTANRATALANAIALNANLAINGANDLNLNGQISGAGQLVKSGTGTLSLGGNNNFTGGIALSGGALMLNSSNALGAGALITSGTATLKNAQPLALGNAISVNGDLTLETSAMLSATGLLSGSGNLTKAGVDELVLIGNNTYNGSLNITGGTVTALDGSALGNPTAVKLAAGTTLNLNGATAIGSLSGGGTVNTGSLTTLTVGGSNTDSVYAGALTGSGMMRKTGTGTLELAGSSTLGDAIDVNGGTLKVSGSVNGGVAVHTGGTASGSGSIGGLLSVDDGGHLAGVSGRTLTAGRMVFTQNANIDAALGSPATGNTALFRSTGDLTLNGVLNITDAGGFGNGVYRLFDYTGGLTNNILDYGTLPGSMLTSDLTLQTAIPHEVNLILASPNRAVQFWDGGNTVMNGAIEGGSGVWNATNTNWTASDGNGNRTWLGQFAVFQGAAGTVTVEGVQTVDGMQFMTDGYQLANGANGSLNAVNRDGGKFAVRVDPNVTATIGLDINGSGTLQKLDHGRLVLNGNNGYAGGTLLDGGTLVAGRNSALGAGALTAAAGTTLANEAAITLTNDIIANGQLTLATGNNLTLNGAISGSGGLTKIGADVLTLGGTNSFHGPTVLNAGTLMLASANPLGSGALDTAHGTQLNNSLDLSMGNQINLAGNLTLRGDKALTLNGQINGAGSLTKVGSGTLTLNGANAFAGGVNLMGGSLSLGNAAALGSGTLTVGTTALLNTSGALALANNVQMNARLIVNGVGDLNLNGVLSGSSGLTKNGPGGLTLNGANLHRGNTFLYGGELTLGNSSALGTGTLSVEGASRLTANGPLSIGNQLYINDTLEIASDNHLSLNGIVQGAGTLVKSGSGSVMLGSNAFRGTFDVSSGSLILSNQSTQYTSAKAIIAANADLQLANSANLSGLAGAGTLIIGAGHTLTLAPGGLPQVFNGRITGAGALTHGGSTIQTLSGENDFTGQTTLKSGTLLIDGSLTRSNVLVENAGTLGGSGSIGGTVTFAGGGSMTLASGRTLSVGALALAANSYLYAALGAPTAGGGNALLNVNGDLILDGTLDISNAGGFGTGVYRLMNYTGTLTDNGLKLGSLPGIVVPADLQLQTAVNNQINLLYTKPDTSVQFWDADDAGRDDGVIAGGSGTWGTRSFFPEQTNWTDVNGTSNRRWDGGFAVFQGTAGVVFVIGEQRITGMQFLTDGYKLYPISLGGIELVNGPLGDTPIRVEPGVTTTIDVGLFGSGTLGKYGAGTLVLSSNSYQGGTALNGGTLVLGTGLSLGSGTLTAAGGTTLYSNADIAVNNNVVLNGALTIAGSKALALNGSISGGGGLVKSGTSSLSLNGSNTYSGGTLLNAGSLIVGNNSALGSGTLMVGGAATLDASQALSLANNVALNAGLTVQGSRDLTLNGNISGPGSLTKNGASTLTLNGVSAYTGGTYVNSGRLVLGAAGSLAATGIVNIASGATFDLSAGRGTQVFGTLAGSGTVLMGSNSLIVGGATDGSFDGSVSGTGTLIKQGAGTQTLTGANSYAGGTLVAEGTLRAGSATALAQNTAYQVQPGATLDLNGNALQASSLDGAGTVALGGARLTTDIAAGALSSYAGIIVGNGTLVKTGAGALALTGGSAFSGGVQLKQGRIGLGHAQGLGSGTLAMDDGTVISLIANGMTIANNLHMTGTNDPVIDTGANTATWAGAITGAGFLTKQGTGVLTLTSAGNSYTGATDVAQGTLKAGAANTFSSASAHTVTSGAVLDLAGYSQTVASLNNSGAVNLSGGTPGATLKVTGPYVGNNGKLGVSTVLGADGSATDKLLLSGAGAIASGSTTVQITNAGGLGAQTGKRGITVIATENGASLQPGSFTLAGGHIDAGAYEYRLAQTAQGAALHSTNTQPGPAYREEVPLLSALPAQLRQADMAMLGDMRKRMGDEAAQGAIDLDPSHRAWARVLRTAPTITQQGTVNPESSGHLTGFQAGVDVYASRNLRAGLYVGQLDGDMGVRGFSSGMERKYAGYNNLRGRYVGLYGTWQHDSGLYADAVIQGADYRSSLRTADTGAGATTKGHGWLASLEVGKPIDLGNSWQLEPQAQIIYRKLNLDDTTLSLAKVKNDADDDWTLRLGARVKGSYSIGGTVLQPFARVNLYKASNTTDVASFSAPAGTTDIRAKGGYTSTELAVGAMLQLTKSTSLYGDVGKLWANSGDSRVKTGAQGSIGLRVLW